MKAWNALRMAVLVASVAVTVLMVVFGALLFFDGHGHRTIGTVNALLGIAFAVLDVATWRRRVGHVLGRCSLSSENPPEIVWHLEVYRRLSNGTVERGDWASETWDGELGIARGIDAAKADPGTAFIRWWGETPTHRLPSWVPIVRAEVQR